MKEFYIGYLPKMPQGLAKLVRLVVIAVFLIAAAAAFIFVTGQDRFANAVFEFGNVKDFEGTIQAEPIPFLIVRDGERENGLPGFERIALVAAGKHGAHSHIREFDGRRVKLRGTLIYRDETRMIEIEDGSVSASGGEPVPATEREEDLGEMSLKGEIIDSKCYLGVMNPGNHKTHRSCAVACLRGGVPAMFLVKDEEGRRSELWLLSSDGEPGNDQMLDYVAEPVELKGRVVRRGDSLFFHADLGSIRRL